MKAIESSREIMEEIHHRVPDIEVRDEQIEALDKIYENEQAGNPASLISLPPGLGKTIILAADTRRRLLQNPTDRGLFLCDNNDIINQAHETFEQIVGQEFSYGLFSGDGRNYDELSMLFGSFQVMREWRQAFFQDEFGFGIVDESHHSKATTYEPTLDYFDFSHLLGATATPDRQDTRDIRDIFGNECYKLTLEEALARRLLAAVDYHIVTDEIVETGVVQDVEGYFYNLKDFNQSVFVPRRDDEIVRIAKRYAEKIKNPKTIGFCRSIEHATVMAEAFGDAAAYHSDLPRNQQRDILKRFRNGELKAIFTVSKFDEGVDIPEANQILFLRATGSKRVFLQQFGRGLRKTKTKKRVQVLDFVNNAERLLLVDRIWRDAATIARGETPVDEEVWEIDVNNITFNESSRSALRILRAINANVYRPDQAVPEGSKLAAHLARDLNMSKAALLSMATSLRIEPQKFPTQRGSEVPYFLSDDVERIIRERIRRFGKL